jgi:YNFM family putative membrane transporter
MELSREPEPMIPTIVESVSKDSSASIERHQLQPTAVAVMAFLTVVDLFAAQAILPALAAHYAVSPAAMGTAVNACTIGMAVASLFFARFGASIDKRLGVATSLALLSIPTAFLAWAPDLPTFAMLRFLQGLCMAGAFTLTLAHLAERTSGGGTASVFAAYVTGNVASNLLGRLMSATLADLVGLSNSFQAFAALNVAGAVLALLVIGPGRLPRGASRPTAMKMSLASIQDVRLIASFAIGCCILFAFIGTFTYINFVLVSPPYSLDMMSLGLVYVVFLPSIVTTPLAGRLVERVGTRAALLSGLILALLGLVGVLAASFPAVVSGLFLVAIGTFQAQATTTGYVARIAKATGSSSTAASGVYLAAYFLGGLLGSVVLGLTFDRWGWTATVVGIASSLLIACALAWCLHDAQEAPEPAGPFVGATRP